ncbi:hypothetical protein CAOG_06241 [Capsaspora owczarzaki ATCC 30864]|uniref:Uncharacterized protein n=1 Tax=Capsaspora owczarzaki (strain ATCC 30864) TaxID=595528 RepID=A0A0D2VWB1_CAPO3|nr:hypothetical protein CAOG_06241 [Capsaspora owczarzaki ATCC 30864]KJE95837.1 hypothetical protein CAOG_006241 [Capsaspora owczarzaki ATCC 30864]|eukprot:XP_004344990.1 hypothetical protein CAOG_06241 [Capsaspora owczarzaki ATCC 30864]
MAELCEFPFALSLNCTQTIAEDLGAHYYAPQGVLGGTALIFAAYSIFQLVSVLRCKGFSFKSLQHQAIYHSTLMALCLLARTTDLYSWSNRIPFLVHSLLTDYCSALSLSMAFSLVQSWIDYIHKATLTRRRRHGWHVLLGLSHFLAWLAFPALGVLACVLGPYPSFFIAKAAGTVALVLVWAVLGMLYGTMVLYLLRESEARYAEAVASAAQRSTMKRSTSTENIWRTTLRTFSSKSLNRHRIDTGDSTSSAASESPSAGSNDTAAAAEGRPLSQTPSTTGLMLSEPGTPMQPTAFFQSGSESAGLLHTPSMDSIGGASASSASEPAAAVPRALGARAREHARATRSDSNTSFKLDTAEEMAVESKRIKAMRKLVIRLFLLTCAELVSIGGILFSLYATYHTNIDYPRQSPPTITAEIVFQFLVYDAGNLMAILVALSLYRVTKEDWVGAQPAPPPRRYTFYRVPKAMNRFSSFFASDENAGDAAVERKNTAARHSTRKSVIEQANRAAALEEQQQQQQQQQSEASPGEGLEVVQIRPTDEAANEPTGDADAVNLQPMVRQPSSKPAKHVSLAFDAIAADENPKARASFREADLAPPARPKSIIARISRPFQSFRSSGSKFADLPRHTTSLNDAARKPNKGKAMDRSTESLTKFGMIESPLTTTAAPSDNAGVGVEDHARDSVQGGLPLEAIHSASASSERLESIQE